MDSELSSLTDVESPSPILSDEEDMEALHSLQSDKTNDMDKTQSMSTMVTLKVPLKKIKWKISQSPDVSSTTSLPAPSVGRKAKNKRKVKDQVIDSQEIIQAEANEENDIIESSITIALTDPITKARMLTPVRSTKCAHIDSFDLDSFFALHNISKVKLKSRRFKTDLSALKTSSLSLHQRLNPYANDAPAKSKHEFVNKMDYVMLKLENKHMGRDNNNLRYFACPICDKEFDIFNDLYSVDFLQEIIVELHNILINKNAPTSFIDVLTQRKHDFKEVTHVVINRDGTYNYHVEDKYRESLERHELVELIDNGDDDELAAATTAVPNNQSPQKTKRRKITIELSDSGSSPDGQGNDYLNESGRDIDNPIFIED